jgi:hypothetical protein
VHKAVILFTGKDLPPSGGNQDLAGRTTIFQFYIDSQFFRDYNGVTNLASLNNHIANKRNYGGQMMKCFNCGTELTDGANFCSCCGAKITAPEPPVEEKNVVGDFVSPEEDFAAVNARVDRHITLDSPIKDAGIDSRLADMFDKLGMKTVGQALEYSETANFRGSTKAKFDHEIAKIKENLSASNASDNKAGGVLEQKMEEFKSEVTELSTRDLLLILEVQANLYSDEELAILRAELASRPENALEIELEEESQEGTEDLESEAISRKPIISPLSIFGIGFAVIILGIIIAVSGAPYAGQWTMIVGAAGVLVGLFWLIIKTILATEAPAKIGLTFVGAMVAVLAVIGIGLALDLGAVGTGILVVVIFIVGLCIKCAIDNTACPQCGKKFAMKEISRQLVGSRATTMDVTRRVKNSKGEVIRTYTEAVLATLYTYDCIDECRFCGHRQEVRREKKERD